MSTFTAEQKQRAIDLGISEDEIANYERFGSVKAKDTKLTQLPGNILPSVGGLIKDISTALFNPIETTKAIGDILQGIGSKGARQMLKISGVPEERIDQIPKSPEEQLLEAIGDYYKDRYGSLDKAKIAFINDPAGVALDASIVFGGSGAIARGVGLAKTGKVLSQAGRVIDPLRATERVAGKIIGVVRGKGRQIRGDIAEAAKRTGVTLPASSINESRTVALMEGLAAKGFFNKRLVDKVVDAFRGLNRVADDIVSKTGASPNLSRAGEVIVEGLDRFKKSFFQQKEILYSKVDDVLKGTKITINPTRTRSFAGKLLTERKRATKVIGGKEGDIKFFQGIVDKTRQKPTIQQWRSGIKELNRKIEVGTDPIITGNQAEMTRLVATMQDDLDRLLSRLSKSKDIQIKPNQILQVNELTKAIAEANSFFRGSLEKVNTAFGKSVVRFAGNPEKIVPKLISKSVSVRDAKKIISIIGEKNMPVIRATILDNMFQSAKVSSGKIDFLSPRSITREINKIGRDKLKVILPNNQFVALENLEKMVNSLKNFEKVAEGSQTAYLGRLFGEGALLWFDPFTGVSLLAGDALFSNFIGSTLGQNVLKRGLVGVPGVKRTLEIKESAIAPLRKISVPGLNLNNTARGAAEIGELINNPLNQGQNINEIR